jgi:hypothetical protein
MMYVEYQGKRGIVINETVIGSSGLNLWNVLLADGSTIKAPMWAFVLCAESHLAELQSTPISSYGDIK